jgi:hypothetical protein
MIEKNRKIIFGILIIFCFVGCQSCGSSKTHVDNQTQVDSSELVATKTITAKPSVPNPETKSDSIKKLVQKWNFVFPHNFVVFAQSAKIYAEPDTTSKVLKTVKFGANLDLRKCGYANNVEWYQVDSYEFGNDIVYNSNCYIRSEDVITHPLSGNNLDVQYFAVTGNSKYNLAIDEGFRGTTLYKYNVKKRQFVDTLILQHNRGSDGIKKINHVSWINVDILISVAAYGHSCGMDGQKQFIVDANGKLSVIISSGYWGEIGDDWGTEDIWLPMKFGDEVLLVGAEHIEDSLDDISDDAIFSFPKNINFKKNELVVYKSTEHTPMRDKQGNAIENTNGSYKEKVKENTIFYRWNGNKLVQIKI